MKVLLISEDIQIRIQTQRMLKDMAQLNVCSFENMEQEKNIQYDILIIDFNQMRVKQKEYKAILDIRNRKNIPILALLETSSILDQFEVLSMGVLDFLERPVNDEVYLVKIKQLCKWKWYFDWEKKYEKWRE